MSGITLAVPVVGLLMSLVSIIIGRRILDPGEKIDKISKEIEQETIAIRQNLHRDNFSKSESKAQIAESTRKIAELCAKLRDLGVCKQVFGDANMVLVLVLLLLLPLVFLILYPVVNGAEAQQFEPLASWVGLLIFVIVFFLAGMTGFYFLIYRLHHR